MKQPKEPKSFRYSRMYAVFDPKYSKFCRLYIIDPNGSVTWFNGFYGDVMPYHDLNRRTGNACVRSLKQYERLTYVGEIK